MKQQQLDFDRGSQLALLRDAVLPSRTAKDGRGVSAAAQRAVLRVIDDHGRGHEAWLGFETIALESSHGVRTVKRAVEVLAAASLLIVQPRRCPAGVVCNHYRIVWSELALLRRPARENDTPAPVRLGAPTSGHESAVRLASPVTQAALGNQAERGSVAVDERPERVSGAVCAPERSATITDRSATITDRSATMARKAPGSAPEAPPPPTPATSEWAAAAAKFRGRIGQIDRLAEDARAAGESAAAFAGRVAAAIATAEANASKLASVTGAAVYFLRCGAWPVDDLVDPTAANAAAAKRRATDERQTWSSKIMGIVRDGRRRKVADEKIREVLARSVPREFLVAEGWAEANSDRE